jgi:hypothetical protein
MVMTIPRPEKRTLPYTAVASLRIVQLNSKTEEVKYDKKYINRQSVMILMNKKNEK